MEEEVYYRWKFITKDGEELYPLFTDREIAEKKEKYPSVRWND